MKVKDVINRVQDIDLAITKVEDETQSLSENDRKHILMYMKDYKTCLLSLIHI